MSKYIIQDQRRIVCQKWLHLFIRNKKVNDYSHKSIDNFNLIIVNPSPKLTDQENKNVMNYFGSSYQDQFIETNTKKL